MISPYFTHHKVRDTMPSYRFPLVAILIIIALSSGVNGIIIVWSEA
jgi:hypothetical protein